MLRTYRSDATVGGNTTVSAGREHGSGEVTADDDGFGDLVHIGD